MLGRQPLAYSSGSWRQGPRLHGVRCTGITTCRTGKCAMHSQEPPAGPWKKVLHLPQSILFVYLEEGPKHSLVLPDTEESGYCLPSDVAEGPSLASLNGLHC